MSEYKYKYVCPTERGYKKVHISRRQHNKNLKRKLKWLEKADYFINDKYIIIHFYYNNLFIILEFIILPLEILINGLRNIKSTLKSYTDFFNKKEKGQFYSYQCELKNYDLDWKIK